MNVPLFSWLRDKRVLVTRLRSMRSLVHRTTPAWFFFFYFFEAPHPTREEKEEDRWITCCCNTLHPLSTDQVRAGRRRHSSRPPNGKIFYFLSRFLFLLRCSNFYFSARKETRHCTKYHERKKRHSRARKAETKLSPHFDQSWRICVVLFIVVSRLTAAIESWLSR
jgi:hypothetical protein